MNLDIHFFIILVPQADKIFIVHGLGLVSYPFTLSFLHNCTAFMDKLLGRKISYGFSQVQRRIFIIVDAY
ncbi:hypothetical protein D3C81_1940260 [compost metagenome]